MTPPRTQTWKDLQGAKALREGLDHKVLRRRRLIKAHRHYCLISWGEQEVVDRDASVRRRTAVMLAAHFYVPSANLY